MAKDIFDEIIEFLQERREISPVADINPDLLERFFSDQAVPDAIVSETQVYEVIPENKSSLCQDVLQISEKKSIFDSDDKLARLESLACEVSKCKACRLCESCTNTVFGAGNPNTELMFIGEGPGEEEDRQGLPFVGRAGELLTKMIAAMQFDRKDVYIANIVKCRPPNNRTPFDDEAEQCLPFLKKQIDIIAPKVIVLLGNVPLKALMGTSGITKLHGQWMDYKGIKTLPTFHPAYLLRNPPAKKDAWEDLKKVMSYFGKNYQRG